MPQNWRGKIIAKKNSSPFWQGHDHCLDDCFFRRACNCCWASTSTGIVSVELLVGFTSVSARPRLGSLTAWGLFHCLKRWINWQPWMIQPRMMLIPILSSSHHQLDAGQGNASHSQRQRHSTTGEGFRSSTKPHAAPPRKSSHLIEHSSMDATAISNLVFANLSEAANYVSLPEGKFIGCLTPTVRDHRSPRSPRHQTPRIAPNESTALGRASESASTGLDIRW